jgi:solute carrier family 45 protein 1/2/4
MSSSRIDDNVSEAGSISSRRSAPRPPPIDTQTSNSGRPRPKFVSFGRDSEVGAPPNREFINESSPLINPADRSRETDRLLKEPLTPKFGQEDDDYFPEFEETKSSFFLFLLTLGGLGLQIGWSVETSNGSVRTHWVHAYYACASQHCLKNMTLTRMCSLICCPLVSASQCLLSSGSLVLSQVY